MKKILSLMAVIICLPLAVLADDAVEMSVDQVDDTQWTLNVALNNTTTNYQGLQIDFVLPANVTADISSLAATSRLANITLQANIVEGGNLRVVGYTSSKIRFISGTSGNLFSINLKSSTPLAEGTYEIRAKNVRFSSTSIEHLLPGAYTQFVVSNATKYTLTYHNGNEVYQTMQVAEGAAIPTVNDPEPKTGYSFCGWGEVPDKMPSSNLDLYATWCPIHYNIFYLVDNDTVHTEQVAYGSALPNYEPDGKEGYAFAGWQDAPLSMPANDICLTATWEVIKYTINYYVDNELVHTEQVTYGEKFQLYNYTPEAGRVVSSWEGDVYETMPAYDLMYTATTRLVGDVNLDGVLNTADVVSIYNYITSGEESGIEKENADVNNDGTVNTADVAAVYNAITGTSN